MTSNNHAEVVVIGSGPGGYAAAFRAADLGKQVTLIERYDTLGGVCLNVGCIPSKALLHIAKVITETQELHKHGVDFSNVTIDNSKILAWKNSIVSRLTGGLQTLAKQRKVTVINGNAQFKSSSSLSIITGTADNITEQELTFDHAIIGAGSRPIDLPFLPKDERIINSTQALQLKNTKGKMLVIGGGIIGLEMATVYAALGAEITIIELMDQLIPGCDADIVKPLHKRLQQTCKQILLQSKVTAVTADDQGLHVTYETPDGIKEETFAQILCAVGRKPNSDILSLDKAGLALDQRGFIVVDSQQRTNIPNIYAIGDIVGMPMLAHKSTPQGKIAAEVIAGLKHYFSPRCIPNVAYTDPEIAWVGISEIEAKAQNIPYGVGIFPWAASGRSLCLGRSEGFTKLLINPKTQRILGGAIVGSNAGDLISELVLAIEMGCDVADLELVIHPHPTLAETIGLAAEAFTGTITDLYMPGKQHKTAV